MAISLTLDNTTFDVGDTIRVHYRIIEKEIVSGKTKKEKHEQQKERIQVFEGICIAIRGGGNNQSFTVRRIGVDGIGIERIFPVISPWIKKVTVKKKGDVRRAKLYYLRSKTGKQVKRLGTFVKEQIVSENKTLPKSEQTNEPATAKTTADTSINLTDRAKEDNSADINPPINEQA